MAGKGQRFVDKGFTTPKQLIQVGSKTMLEWSLCCIERKDCDVIFVVRRDMVENYNIDKVIQAKFGPCNIVIAEKDTAGTVCSCLLAEEFIGIDIPLSISTLDMYFRPNFDPHSVSLEPGGMILTFKASNPGYSYSVVENGVVTRTAEKELISDNASVGLYCFSSGKVFVKYAKKMIERNIRARNEFYVCPMYNLLIEDGLKVTTRDVTEMYHMGTPNELEYFLKNDLDILES